MTLDTSKKILSLMGLLSIIFGILVILLGVILLAGSKAATASGEVVATAEELRAVTLVSIFTIVAGVITFLQGIFSRRASKDFTKIKPAWIFAILGLIFSVVNCVLNIVNDATASSIFSGAISIALAILIFAAANKIKKSVGQ